MQKYFKEYLNGPRTEATYETMIKKMKYAANKKRKAPSKKRTNGYRIPATLTSKGAEKKAVDIPATTTNFVNTLAAFVLLNPVQQGPAYYNRIGSRIELSSLNLRGIINPLFVNNAVRPFDIGRIIIFYDRQTNGVLPTQVDLLQTRDQAGNATNVGLSPINLDNRDRFLIIRDYQMYFPENDGTGITRLVNTQGKEGNNEYSINMHIKLKGLQTMYKSTSNPITAGDIATGGLFIGFISHSTTASKACTWTSRLRYKDN